MNMDIVGLKKMYENIGIHMACGNGSEMTRTSNV